MNTGLLHTVFAIILVTSVATRERSTDVLRDGDDIAPAIIGLARLHGLRLEEETATGPVRTLAFEAPACGRPVLISLLDVTLAGEPVARAVGGQRDVVRYLYLDRTWNAPDRLSVFFEWKKHKAFALFGLTRYVPSRYMLRLASPPGCEIADTIDWRTVWSRDYLTAVRDTKLSPPAM